MNLPSGPPTAPPTPAPANGKAKGGTQSETPVAKPPQPFRPQDHIAMGQLGAVPDYVAKFLIDLSRKVLGLPEGGIPPPPENPAMGLPSGPTQPTHGYNVAEAGPEVVTAPGSYFPSTQGQVIPMESRQGGGDVYPSETRYVEQYNRPRDINELGTPLPLQYSGERGILNKVIPESLTGTLPPIQPRSVIQSQQDTGYDPFLAARQTAGTPELTTGPQTFKEGSLYQNVLKPAYETLIKPIYEGIRGDVSNIMAGGGGGLPSTPTPTTIPPGYTRVGQTDIRMPSIPRQYPEGQYPADYLTQPAASTLPTGEMAGWENRGEGVNVKLPSDWNAAEEGRRFSAANPNGYYSGVGRPMELPSGPSDRGYWAAHPEEKAAQDYYDMTRGPAPSSYEAGVARMKEMGLEDQVKDRNIPKGARLSAAQQLSDLRKANADRDIGAAKGYADIYGKGLEHGPAGPGSQLKLAEAEYYRQKPGIERQHYSEYAQARVDVARELAAQRIQVATDKREADMERGQLNLYNKVLSNYKKKDMMTGSTVPDLEAATPEIKRLVKAGLLHESYGLDLPEPKPKESDIRADLKAHGMKDKEINDYIKRAREAGKI